MKLTEVGAGEDRPMSKELTEAIEAARTIVMSKEEKEQQRRGFVFGNLKIGRPELTRESIDAAAEKIKSR